MARSGYQQIGIHLPRFAIQGAITDYKGQRRMLWEYTRAVLGKDTPNYRQEIGDCKIAGTQIDMADGSTKAIEDVHVGEYVISHKNNMRRVTRTIHKKYSGLLYTIKAKGHYAEVTSTADHQYVTYTNKSLDVYNWTPIKEIKEKSDSVLVPYGIQNIEYQFVEFNGRKILVDTDFSELIGWYLAEGGASGKELLDGTYSYQKVTFNLGRDEEQEADRIISILNNVFGVVGVKQYHKSKKGSLLVEVYDHEFSKFIKKLIPGNVYTKRIPALILRSPSMVKMSLLRGWVSGDGQLDPRSNLAMGTSVSHGMIRDFYHLSVSIGLKPCVHYAKQYKHQNVRAGVISFRGTSGCKVMGTDLPNRDHARFSNLGLTLKVKTNTFKEVENIDVYCLEVEEDCSFIANGYAVHNCTSFSGKNVLEYLSAVQIALGGMAQKWHPIFPPYFYGASRVLIGNGQIWGDGSTGVWTQEAAKKYGVLAADETNVPQYSGAIAKAWGRTGPPSQFLHVGETHLVKTTAIVQTSVDAANAILNGYPCSICSNWGFQMEADSSGFMEPQGTWGHAMSLIGFEDHPQKGFYFIILNSWGDVHGHLIDFTSEKPLPVGVLRVKAEYVNKMLAEQDSFAFSAYDGYPDQNAVLDKALFDIVGS